MPEADLPGYRYMIGMERIDSMRNELASFTSFGEALKTVRANLAKGVGGTSAVYEVVLPEAKLAVIGVAMNDPKPARAGGPARSAPTTWPPCPTRSTSHRRQGLRALRPLPHRAVVAGAGHGAVHAHRTRPDLIHETLARVAGAAAR